ncbi:MAG TPA: gluconate 2-dehydrogenase subunit 3 family protein [Candidatus Binatia bacterium]|nr:gluconate 2-dehydrogenase subunit 3 family protein [Candidatus Binatia bacterium]
MRVFAVAAGLAVVPRHWLRAAPASRRADGGVADIFSSQELATLDAATARIVPSDPIPGLPGTQIGARECGVIDYIQSLLTYFPGADANCDRRFDAADLTATILAAKGTSSECLHGDANGDGTIDVLDLTTTESAPFRARPAHAGGPFSGRQPQPHFNTGATACVQCHGIAAPGASGRAAATMVDNYPPDFFRETLPLSRVRLLGWKIRVLGASAVPEAAANPLATGSIDVDLRRKYHDGLAAIETRSRATYGKSFVDLTADQQRKVLDASDPNFTTLLTYHTLEGMFGAPEYGGNRDRLGWQLIHFDGDSQPLGYTIYDESIAGYRERPDKPNSGPNPDEDCRGFTAAVNAFLTVISTADLVKPGGPFASPFCFDVAP